jgi:uncharacterized protein YaaQ
MKMVMAVVQRDEAENVLQALIAAGHTATLVESRGGMLRQAWMTMFVAVKKEDVDPVLSIIKGSCTSDVSVEPGEHDAPLSNHLSSAKAKVGGAVVFVWDLDKFEVY